MTPDALLDRFAAAPGRAALFCDFDGTLADIVPEPGAAVLRPGLLPVLEVLARRLGVLAIVSGRPSAFLAAQVPLDGIRRLGLYGLEEWVEDAARLHPHVADWVPAVRDAVAHLTAAVADLPGCLVEDKGLSVAVHWRNAPDREAAAARIGALTAGLSAERGLVREPGKLVEELRPPVDWDKGEAVRAVMASAPAGPLAFLGDDLGDLKAFWVTRELGGCALAVAAGPETPAELVRAADAVLDGPAAVAGWLTALAQRVDPG